MLRTPPDRVVQEMPVRHASKQERSITKESIPAVTSALHAIIESIVWPVCCLHKELPADLSTLATTLMSPDKRTPKAPTASFNISSTSQSITPAFVAGSAGVIGGILLSGPPGVGKTYSLRALQQIQFERCRVNVKEIKLRDILTADNAVAELILSFSNATTSLSETSSCAQLVLILLDEIDSLGSGEADTESQHLVKHYLCKWMDKPPVVITGTYFVFVATTNRPGDVDPQLRTGSRLAKEINFLTSSIADKELLLLSMLTGVVLGIHKDDKAGLAAQLGPRLGGYAAADIALLVGDALRLQERSQKSLQQCLEIVHATITPSCLRSNVITVPPIKYSDIIGHEEAKKCFRRALSYYEKSGGELYHRFGLAAPDGILLYGPPGKDYYAGISKHVRIIHFLIGNSKTRLVMAAAHENGLPVISLSGADVYSAFVGICDLYMGYWESNLQTCPLSRWCRGGNPTGIQYSSPVTALYVVHG